MNLENSVGFLMSRTHAKMKNNLNNALKSYHVTVEQWVLLNRLWEQDGISQKALSEKCLKDQPTTTRILDKLEKRRLICRKADPEDRRAFLIHLTPEGLTIRNPLQEAAEKALAQSLASLTPEEQEHLKKLLNKIWYDSH